MIISIQFIKKNKQKNKRMDKFTITEQSRIVEEIGKSQPQLSHQQLANIEVVQKTIKRYQTKISDMLKIIQKQRKQNQSLKNELKQLNENLNLMIEKINLKNIKKEEAPNPKQDAVKKSLQNQIKKSVAMKKQLDTLRAKAKIFEGQKVTDLQDQIRQKDKVIQQQSNKIKLYQKLEKLENNLDIYKKYNEANEKINSLNGELIHIKKKLNEAKKIEEQQEKSIKRQHEQLLSLQKKDQKKEKHQQVFIKRDDKIQTSSQQIIKLKEKMQALENAKRLTEKALKLEIQNLKAKNFALQNQLEQFKKQISRKDKQASILAFKMKQLSRRSQPNFEMIEKTPLKAEDINNSNLFDHRKQFKGLVYSQNNVHKFDDTETLPLEKTYQIKSLKFIWFEEHILSLSTNYQLKDGSLQSIQSFSINHQYKNTKQQSLVLNDFEYIQEIEIYCSRFIEFIKIKTSRNQLLEAGNDKNYTKCKKFIYDIKSNEKPIAFMGVIETKKLNANQVNGNNKDYLVSLGLQIKKKDVYTKNKFTPSISLRSESVNRKAEKTVSRFSQLEKQENDKNKKMQIEIDQNQTKQ